MTDDLSKLAIDLGRLPFRLVPAIEAVTKYQAEALARKAKQNATALRSSSGTSLREYPASITAERGSFSVRGVEYVIGPDKDKRQGALGNVLEYGTSRHAPQPHLAPALESIAPLFLTMIGEAAAGVTVSMPKYVPGRNSKGQWL